MAGVTTHLETGYSFAKRGARQWLEVGIWTHVWSMGTIQNARECMRSREASAAAEAIKMGSHEGQTRRGMPIAEAVRWTNLVSYQEGSVVSRAIVSRNTGTVTLFAFDEGQGLSEHTAPFDALVHLLKGEAGDCNFGQTASGQGG